MRPIEKSWFAVRMTLLLLNNGAAFLSPMRKAGVSLTMATVIGATTLVSANASEFKDYEMSTAAAAVVTLAQKCSPESYRDYKAAALRQLAAMLKSTPHYDLSSVVDAAESKIIAFSVSSKDISCEESKHFETMARTWGFANFFSK